MEALRVASLNEEKVEQSIQEWCPQRDKQVLLGQRDGQAPDVLPGRGQRAEKETLFLTAPPTSLSGSTSLLLAGAAAC